MKRIVLLLLLTAPAVLTASPVELAPPESVGLSSTQLERLKDRLQQELDNETTGGIQVLIARRGAVVMHENLGYADVEEQKSITDETLFRIYSMTKPVVGAAMMMLYEEGVFSLDDPLWLHIPEFADLRVYAGVDENGEMILEDPDREPTIQDLMRHTAGFTYGMFGETPVDRMYREKQVLQEASMQELIDKLATIPLLFQPGERWVYSVSVDIQGYLIEKWTGQELDEFLQERLFDPLGMDQTMDWTPSAKADLLAGIYTHVDGKRTPGRDPAIVTHLQKPAWFSGGGQLISTAGDYWRFAQMLLNGGEFDGKRYLSRSSVEMMSANRLPGDMEIGIYDGSGFGLNVAVVTKTKDVGYPASDGEYFWSGLATTLFWIDPKEDLIAVMMTQYLPFNDLYFRDIIHRMVYPAILD